MPDILLHEWDERLSAAAALHGADGGAVLHNNSAQWTAPLGGLSVAVGLRIDRGNGCMVAECAIGQSSHPMGDAAMAAVVLADSLATLHRALAVRVKLDGLRVWIQDCPCNWCSGRGENSGRPCEKCGGTGKRNVVDPDAR